MPTAIQQRCWNHELREAVCRCLGCGRSYCRECVTEHTGRLLCAGCIAKEGVADRPRSRRFQGLGMPLAAMLAFFFAWLVLYGTGAGIITLTQRMEQRQWLNR